jgi:hypothetical protein
MDRKDQVKPGNLAREMQERVRDMDLLISGFLEETGVVLPCLNP